MAADPESIYVELRDQVLTVDPAAVGLAPSPDHPNVWGVLMDLGYPEGTATVVGLSDGTTSLYTSSGGGVIGGGQHPTVADATLRWLGLAETAVAGMDATTEFPLPEPGQVALVVLTYGGAYRRCAAETVLAAGDDAVSALFFAGHDVITELRRAEEAMESS